MAKKKRKSSGHVAIPFLIALLLGIVGIGGVAMYVFQWINRDEGEIKQMPISVTKPTEENNMTLLFVLDEKENTSLPTTFVVARVLPVDKKIVFLCFPENMLAVVNGQNDTLTNFYHNGGINSLKAAIEDQTGIVTDRYFIMDSDGFQKICNIYAGVEYKVPLGTKGFVDNSGPQYLGPGQIEKLVTYPFFDTGEIQRCATTSDVLAEMVNLTDRERIVASMDANFRTLVNMMETDVTSVDYSNEKNALKYIYSYGNVIASFRIVTGVQGEDSDVFIISDTFKNSVSDIFDRAHTSKPAATEAVPADAPAQDVPDDDAEDAPADAEDAPAEGDADAE